MDVFDQRFCVYGGLCTGNLVSHGLLLKEFLQYGDERAVAAHEVDRVSSAVAEMSKTETHESLSRPRDTGEKTDDMLMLCLCVCNDSTNLFGNGLNIVFGGFGVRDLSDV
jgi:hypothetical protein